MHLGEICLIFVAEGLYDDPCHMLCYGCGHSYGRWYPWVGFTNLVRFSSDKEVRLMRNLIDLINALARLIAELRKAAMAFEHHNRK
jgi:hypothetical protein